MLCTLQSLVHLRPIGVPHPRMNTPSFVHGDGPDNHPAYAIRHIEAQLLADYRAMFRRDCACGIGEATGVAELELPISTIGSYMHSDDCQPIVPMIEMTSYQERHQPQ